MNRKIVWALATVIILSGFTWGVLSVRGDVKIETPADAPVVTLEKKPAPEIVLVKKDKSITTTTVSVSQTSDKEKWLKDYEEKQYIGHLVSDYKKTLPVEDLKTSPEQVEINELGKSFDYKEKADPDGPYWTQVMALQKKRSDRIKSELKQKGIVFCPTLKISDSDNDYCLSLF